MHRPRPGTLETMLNPGASLVPMLAPVFGPATGRYSVPDVPEARLKRARASTGAIVLAFTLMIPSMLNWLVLAYFHWSKATVPAKDSTGAKHEVIVSDTANFEMVFLQASFVCVNTVFCHMWLNLAFIANQQKLSQPGPLGGADYQHRLEIAKDLASRLTFAEKIHAAIVAFDFAFGTLVVFRDGIRPLWRASIGPVWGEAYYWTQGLISFPLVYVIVRVSTRARASVLLHAQTTTATFALNAFRTFSAIFAVEIIYLGCSISWFFHEPIVPICGSHTGHMNPDATMNASFGFVNYVHDCAHACLPVCIADENTTFLSARENAPLQSPHTTNIFFYFYLTWCAAIYYWGRGLDVLNDRLLIDFEMEWNHVLALFLWLIFSASMIVSASLSWGGYIDNCDLFNVVLRITVPSYVVSLICLAAVLWKDSVIKSITSMRGGSGANLPARSVEQDAYPLDVPYPKHFTLTFEKQTRDPEVIMSYASRTDEYKGREHMWALCNVLRAQRVRTFNGLMVKDANWQITWFGKLDKAKVAVIMLSDAYWQSKPCVEELTKILQSSSIKVVIVRFDNWSFAGNFLKHMNEMSEEQQTDLCGFIKKKLDGNCWPPPDKGTGFFQDDFEANAPEFIKRVKDGLGITQNSSVMGRASIYD